MTSWNWLITGVSSGFGRELADQLLDRGDPSSAPSAGPIRRRPRGGYADAFPASCST